MAYRIAYDNTNGVVDVIYEGEVSLEERKKAVEDVCNEFAHLDILPIMVDVRGLEMHLSTTDQKAFGQFLASHPVLSKARVAVLHPETHNPNLLIDTTAFSQGYTLAQFNLLPDAHAWLKQA